jgi:hypothetical protein
LKKVGCGCYDVRVPRYVSCLATRPNTVPGTANYVADRPANPWPSQDRAEKCDQKCDQGDDSLFRPAVARGVGSLF